eukprot:g29672.t1
MGMWVCVRCSSEDGVDLMGRMVCFQKVEILRLYTSNPKSAATAKMERGPEKFLLCMSHSSKEGLFRINTSGLFMNDQKGPGKIWRVLKGQLK